MFLVWPPLEALESVDDPQKSVLICWVIA